MTSKAKKNKIFYLILVIFPVALLIVLEVVLRLFSFGDDYPLFIESDTISGYLQPNPNVIKRYFSAPQLAPNITPDTFYFKRIKPSDSFRIVIQGGSTAAGFPFGRFGSLQGMLQQRFKRIYPNKEIEIISTAMSAVNSYTMLDFTDEILAIKPDLILIYAGHNEFVGIMGVGSTYASKTNRATTLMYLKFKSIKLFQLMQRFVSLFQNEVSASNPSQTNKRTLMAEVAKGKKIVLNSELFHRGVEQFSFNLDMIISNYKEAGIPVLISTLVSNEIDQAPFESSRGEFSANGYFKKATLLTQKKQYKKATAAFIEAKDRDLLRFRAPSVFNKIIRQKIDGKLIQLVDTEAVIRLESSNRIIGFKHIFEHLHPNARGYFLMAEAFSNKIINEKFISKDTVFYPKSLAWNDIPLTKPDLIAAAFKIKTLVADYPFRKEKLVVSFGKANTFEDAIALKKLKSHDWLELQQEMLQYYQKIAQNVSGNDKLIHLQQAAKVAGIIFDAFPNQHKAAWVAGKIYFSINDLNIAEYYLKHAVELQPEQIEYLMSYAHVLYVNTKINKSLAMLNSVLLIQPKHQQALQQKQRLTQEQ